MANVEITSTTNAVKIVANDHSGELGYTKLTIPKWQPYIARKGNYVLFSCQYGAWKFCMENVNHTMKVDTVNGVAPTSRDDLYDKLSALIE